ncbi:hydantoin racemase family protein [Schizosaccharomyces octosporus yFS286]|uniref:Hydantoin racemase family protein n=1 Tax=Schizosaccharomyces octosporus (strain yFS286) TaxID=483514 RepID=S9RHZ2_SCHOY|nr:hydantoin racemase family protein [Schizosaccharomyces octosporus yFS286]EPX73604.1 hydantoin racemase family protein [Schizosaccharomyces octosporus yFS286]
MPTVLVINPNSSHFITNSLQEKLPKLVAPDVTLRFFTCPAPGAAVIDSITEATLTASLVFQSLTPEILEGIDAVVVACYSPTPLVDMVRESYQLPCMGIVQASALAALTVGQKVGVLTSTFRSECLLYELFQSFGLQRSRIAAIASTGRTVLQLSNMDPEERKSLLVQRAQELVRDHGADSICLGGAALAAIRDSIQEAVGPEIPIIDGVHAAVEQLAGLVRQGLTTSKSGIYQYP